MLNALLFLLGFLVSQLRLTGLFSRPTADALTDGFSIVSLVTISCLKDAEFLMLNPYCISRASGLFTVLAVKA